jgi:2-amino-4-hydroxy-6-hydroxymethyldihydropteridine diphosphokinase
MASDTDALQFIRRSETAATAMRTAVALGSNLGGRLENLHAARDAILQLSNVSPPIVSSPVYETEAIDCEAGAGKFLNAVVEFEYQSDPEALLDQLIGIEEALGRKRDHPRNISRIIDIDLLYCGDQQIDNGQLQLPHPRIYSRKFVLKPLADIRPHLVLPDEKKTVSELLTTFDESRDVVRFLGGW